jgi:hypothetical protein
LLENKEIALSWTDLTAAILIGCLLTTSAEAAGIDAVIGIAVWVVSLFALVITCVSLALHKKLRLIGLWAPIYLINMIFFTAFFGSRKYLVAAVIGGVISTIVICGFSVYYAERGSAKHKTGKTVLISVALILGILFFHQILNEIYMSTPKR